VDDASPDGAMKVLAELARKDPQVRICALLQNVGQHRAVLDGLAAARGRWTVVMDADLQDPPEAIPLLLDTAQSAGARVVFAGRRGHYQSAGRLATSRLFKRSLAKLTGLPPDAGLFVLLDRATVDRVLALDGKRPFVTAMIGATGARMVSVPVTRAPRPTGSSAYRQRDRIASSIRAFAWVLSWRLRRATRA
jgi:polyisoprenyl-phosphate glycosyltransferase